MRKRLLVACEKSCVVRDEFIKIGWDAVSCDVQEPERGGPHYRGNVLDIIDDGWDMMIAHPPCTRLANSGVRWLTSPPQSKTIEQIWKDFEFAVDFYKKIRSANIDKIAIENPVMHKYAIKSLGKIKRHIVQPWWFGEKAFKATGFELKNLPPLYATEKLIPPKSGTEEHKQWSWIHRMPPGPDRAYKRSRTFDGIAKAMADQWG